MSKYGPRGSEQWLDAWAQFCEDVRAKLTERGHDAGEVEVEEEGWGQDWSDYDNEDQPAVAWVLDYEDRLMERAIEEQEQQTRA